jgi:hypothetical protein
LVIGKAVAREENRSNDFRCVLQQGWVGLPLSRQRGNFEAACFQGIEVMHGSDAIRLAPLLRKTTLDLLFRPYGTSLTSVTRRGDAGHGSEIPNC